ncbi:MAG: tetratricopeptide repeat protein [Nitrospirae bacterium]|nr:tetratricopeptide repeat protein [Nitrospirota bacterium]
MILCRRLLFGLSPFGIRLRILAASLLALFSPGPVWATPPDARSQLEQKAHYWIANGREDLAAAVYRQLLFLYPNDKRALTGLIQAYLLSGDTRKARPLIRTFGDRFPRSPYLPVFRREEILGPRWSSRIARARKAEKERRYARAQSLFAAAFGNAPPPPSLAREYFHLAEKKPDGRKQGLSELKALTDRYPDSASYRLAYGEILSDQASTRRESLRVLAPLALSTSPEAPLARADWRQSLLWAGDSPSFIPEMMDYRKAFPDPSIDRLIARARKRSLAEGPLPAKAFTALHRGKAQEARDRFRLLIRADPDNPAYWIGLASANLALSRPEKASAALKRAVRLPLSSARRKEAHSLDRQIRYWRLIAFGKAQDRAGKRSKAVRLYRSAWKILPDQTAAPDLLAGLELRMGHPVRALATARRVSAIHPGDRESRMVVLGALESLGRFREAERTLNALPRHLRSNMERSPSFLVLEGTVDAHAGPVARADRELSKAGERSFLLSNRDQIARAWGYATLGETVPLEAILKSLSNRPDLSLEDRIRIRNLERFDLNLAIDRFLARKNGKSAMDRIRLFLRKHPGDRFALRQEVRVDTATGHPRKAYALLRGLHPEKRFSQAVLDIDVALSSGHPETAGRWIDEARRRWGNRVALIVLESRTMAESGHPEKARNTLKDALSKSPRSSRLHLALAQLDLRENRFGKARDQATLARNLAREEPGETSRTNALEAANTLAAISRQQAAAEGSHFEFLLGETLFTQYTQYYYTQVGGFFPVGTLEGSHGREPVYLHAFVQGNAFTFQYHPTPSSTTFLSQSYIGTTPALGLRIPTFFGSVEADAGWGFALHDQTLTPPQVVSGLFLQGDLSAGVAGGNLDFFANYTGYIDYTYFQSRYLHPAWENPEKSVSLAAGPEFIVQGNSQYSAFQGGIALRFGIAPLDSTVLVDGGALGSSAFGGIGGYEGFSWYFYY